ncbi:MAG TPA: FAD-binding oxidoreductase [Candidatus Sulfotelmatobacter sp.]|nr:FAD-binding oxidoreductase [Candidatus Sulfotelmatobacter sp.]
MEAELRRMVRGEVRFDTETRARYSTDASNYRQVPIGLVLPKDAEDVERTLAACRKFDVPVLSRSGGTSLAGETCNVAVVMDVSKYMNRIVGIDCEGKTARAEPGRVNDDLRTKVEENNPTFGLDPATHNHNTFGGMIGNNSCGIHAQMAGKCARLRLLGSALLTSFYRHHCQRIHAVAAGHGEWAYVPPLVLYRRLQESQSCR